MTRSGHSLSCGRALKDPACAGQRSGCALRAIGDECYGFICWCNYSWLISLNNFAFVLQLLTMFYSSPGKLHKRGLSAGLAISETAIALDGGERHAGDVADLSD